MRGWNFLAQKNTSKSHSTVPTLPSRIECLTDACTSAIYCHLLSSIPRSYLAHISHKTRIKKRRKKIYNNKKIFSNSTETKRRRFERYKKSWTESIQSLQHAEKVSVTKSKWEKRRNNEEEKKTISSFSQIIEHLPNIKRIERSLHSFTTEMSSCTFLGVSGVRSILQQSLIGTIFSFYIFFSLFFL